MKLKNPHFEQLKKRIARSPTEPGVYRWMNEKGDVLYIGKAKNLRNRLKSYIAPDKAIGPWKLSLAAQIADFDVTVVNNELEALLLETNLIKKNKPKYNVLMKDDKNYVYVRISVKEPYPRMDIVRKMAEDNAAYFGPYMSAYDIRLVMETIHFVFPYRACKRSLDLLNKPDAPEALSPEENKACLEYQIGQCCGLCIGAITKEDYRKNIEELIRFLKGDRHKAVSLLKEKMQECAKEKKFERAAEIRNVLKIIESFDEKQIVSDTTGEDADIIGTALLSGRGQVTVLQKREGKLVGELSFPMMGEAETAGEVLKQFLPQFYIEVPFIPPMIILGEEIPEKELMMKLLENLRGGKIELRIPERGNKSALLVLAEKNAKQKVMQNETKWESAERNAESALSQLQEILQLPVLPNRIEGYDISHLGGTETVGSMVVMKNGKAANDQYRSFTIKSLKEGDIDDYKSLKEVLKRRLLNLMLSLKEQEKKWKATGFTFGKARKAEQQTIEEVLEHESTQPVSYKDFLIARKGEDVVGFVQLLKHKGNVVELTSLWVKDPKQSKQLGQFLAKLRLSGVKKGKVYVAVNPHLEAFYGEIGFRYIHDTPPVLKEKMKTMLDTSPEMNEVIAMMYEATQNKIDPSLTAPPDLLVIDGGKGQLSSVVEVLKQLDLKIPVIGLAKREEEVFVPGSSGPVLFPNDSQAKFLLMRLRNEAHRFANRHREARGKKHAVVSALDDIPGIGPTTKRELLKKFGSVSGVRKAPDNELSLILTTAQIAELREHLL